MEVEKLVRAEERVAEIGESAQEGLLRDEIPLALEKGERGGDFVSFGRSREGREVGVFDETSIESGVSFQELLGIGGGALQ